MSCKVYRSRKVIYNIKEIKQLRQRAQLLFAFDEKKKRFGKELTIISLHDSVSREVYQG